jgi:prepilin-type N-terminal cleavage/methylation domain-containing protein
MAQGHSPTAARERGFTLLEVLIALLLVVVIASSVAALFLGVMLATDNARHETSATALASQKLEELRSLTWTFAGGLAMSDTTTDLSTSPATSGGQGLNNSPPGTLAASTPGYVDYLDARGRWVGTGPALPSAALYIRRWSIDALAADPDTLLIQVLVTTARRDLAAAAAGGMRRRRHGDALIATLRTRRAAFS